jgi:hypothetical protein
LANWYGSARSNYFRVKDADAFLQWTERRGLGVFKSENQTDVLAIHPGDATDSGSWPSYDMENDAEFDLIAELSAHLVPGQVAVLLEVGAEKLRYLTGQAIAVNAKGRVVEVCLGDIYRKAASAFRVPENEIQRAEY